MVSIVALIGLVVRISYVVVARQRFVGGDGLAYDEAARELADGQGFINSYAHVVLGIIQPSALHPPAWSLTLAGPTWIGLRSTLSHQIVAAVIGAMTVVAVGYAGRTMAGPRVGLVAAMLTAVYPNTWLYERELAAETLTLLLVATLLFVAYGFFRRPDTKHALAFGIALGLLALTRAEQLILGLFLVVPLLLTARGASLRQRARWLAVAVLACAVLVAPWSIYNTRRFDHPVGLSTGLGAAMRQGYCDPAFRGPRLGYYTFACIIHDKVSSNDAVADGQYRKKALHFARDNAGRVPVVLAAREARTFGFFRPMQQMRLDSDRGTYLWVIRSGFIVYWLSLVPAVIGLISLRRRGVPVYPLLALPLTVAVSVALTMGQTRYRAPAEVALVLLAAAGIEHVTTRVRARDTTSPADRAVVSSTE